MSEMMNFVMWFLEQLPSFLLSPPISAFTGFAILLVVIRVFRDIIRL